MKKNKIIYISVALALIGAVFLVADIQYKNYVSQYYQDVVVLPASTTTIAFEPDINPITEECKYVFNNQLEYTKSRVDNNKTAIEIIKNKCLQVVNSSFVADFDRDGQNEIVMITSGAGCGSCHAQEIRIIKDDEVIFYKDGEDFRTNLTKDLMGFTIQYPVTDLSYPEAGYIIESYKMKKDGSGLETFYIFNKETKLYTIQ